MQRGQECGQDHRGSATIHQDAKRARDDQEGHHRGSVLVHVAVLILFDPIQSFETGIEYDDNDDPF